MAQPAPALATGRSGVGRATAGALAANGRRCPAATTWYSNNSELMRDRNWKAGPVSPTARVVLPTVRLICGVPVTVTSRSKSTLTSMGSPNW